MGAGHCPWVDLLTEMYVILGPCPSRGALVSGVIINIGRRAPHIMCVGPLAAAGEVVTDAMTEGRKEGRTES